MLLLLMVVGSVSLEDIDFFFMMVFLRGMMKGRCFLMIIFEDFGVKLFMFIEGFLLSDGANGVFLLVDFLYGFVSNMR